MTSMELERETKFVPKIKQYWMIVERAAAMFEISCEQADEEIRRFFKAKDVPLEALVVYVNWADYNTLSKKEIAKEIGVSYKQVVSWLEKVRRAWPCFFTLGGSPDFQKAAVN